MVIAAINRTAATQPATGPNRDDPLFSFALTACIPGSEVKANNA